MTKTTQQPGNASGLEGGLLVRCTTPPILSCREIAMSLLAQYDLNLLFDEYNTPNLFSRDILYGQSNMQAGRPYSNNIIRKNRIILASNNNEVPTKIKSIEKETFIGEVKNDAQKIFEGKVANGDQILYLSENYTDYSITNGTIISSTRSTITFRRSNSSTPVTITAKSYKHNTNVRRKDIIIGDTIGDVIKTTNALGESASFYTPSIDYYDYWNNGFIADVQFLYDDNIKERAGTQIKLELEQNKAYTGVITELDIDLNTMIGTTKVLCSRNYETILDE